MNQTAAELPFGESEIDFAGLTLAPGITVAPPRIVESPVAMECREHSTIEIGSDRLIIGIITRLYVRDGILDPDSLLVNPENYHPIGRMQVPSGYCRTRDQFEMERP